MFQKACINGKKINEYVSIKQQLSSDIFRNTYAQGKSATYCGDSLTCMCKDPFAWL